MKKVYEKAKSELLNDKSICKVNRDLFKKFFEHEENKLKRINNLSKLDDSTFKTLRGYLGKLKNVNKWFNNKPLKEITKQDMQRVYNGLEDEKILNSRGKPFADKKSYYNKIFKSKLFRMINKDNIARDVLEYYKPKTDKRVRFITEEGFRKLVSIVVKPEHKLLFWLCFDVGENINSLLKLTKRDCMKKKDEAKEEVYHINLRREILKRSRTPRVEITNYNETTELLDIVLSDRKEDDLVFPFGYSAAKKAFERAIRITKIKTIPHGDKPTLKDLRSSMACDLLSKDWLPHEVNSRLGHVPSSNTIDAYLNFLALNKNRPRAKVQAFKLSRVEEELEDTKQRERLQNKRIENLQENFDAMQKKIYKLMIEKGKQRKAKN